MSSERDVYVALVEVTPLEGCQLDPSHFAGAAVRCYVVAESEATAVDRVRGALADDDFQVSGVEWCVGFTSVDWEKPDDATAAGLVNEAVETGEVVYGEFHTWGHDAPDAG